MVNLQRQDFQEQLPELATSRAEFQSVPCTQR